MKQRQGFIVITAVIVLSIILILIAQTLSTTGYLQSSNGLNFEFKELSYYTALSCMDHALFQATQDLDYAGNETLTIGNYQCTVAAFTTQSTNIIIRTSATTETSTTKLKMVVDQYLAIVSFTEE